MRGVSAATLEEVLAAVEGSGTSSIGDELFSVTALLDATPSLRRILTDPATEPDARRRRRIEQRTRSLPTGE